MTNSDLLFWLVALLCLLMGVVGFLQSMLVLRLRRQLRWTEDDITAATLRLLGKGPEHPPLWPRVDWNANRSGKFSQWRELVRKAVAR